MDKCVDVWFSESDTPNALRRLKRFHIEIAPDEDGFGPFGVQAFANLSSTMMAIPVGLVSSQRLLCFSRLLVLAIGFSLTSISLSLESKNIWFLIKDRVASMNHPIVNISKNLITKIFT